MARFTLRELDELTTVAILALCSIEALNIELRVGIAQRARIIDSHTRWVSSMDAETFSSADWNSSIRSNFDLYSELRINGVGFDRIPCEPIFTIDDVEAMSDEEIISIAEQSGLELELSDIRRDVMLRAHAAWAETLSEVNEAVLDSNSRSNWELYSESRINGISPLRPTLVAAPKIVANR
ncbi:hypothetical protein HFN89_07080 [Rhizobium laguerreae]|nr:hypothetical protein [Rhizobium laguerreae]